MGIYKDIEMEEDFAYESRVFDMVRYLSEQMRLLHSKYTNNK